LNYQRTNLHILLSPPFLYISIISRLIIIIIFFNIACRNFEDPINQPILAEEIVFVSTRDGRSQIYKMNLDGTGQINLSENENNEYAPTHLPHSTKIIFETKSENNTDIWSMDREGGSRQKLTDHDGRDQDHVCSPPGTKVAFIRNMNDLFIMNSDGSGLLQLTHDPAAPSVKPQFSPDGSLIVFYKNFDIYTINTDGTNLNNLTNNGAERGEDPVFSPNGEKIVYSMFDLWIMDIDGNNKTQIMETRNATERAPRFLPDGIHLLYYYAEFNNDIHKLNISNYQTTNLTQNVFSNHLDDISGDGSNILFSTNRDGNWEVYMTDVNGDSVKNLSNNSADDYSGGYLSN